MQQSNQTSINATSLSTASSQNISDKTKQLYNESYVCNLALGFEPEIEYPYKWEALERYFAAGFTYVSIHVAIDLTSVERTVTYLAKVLDRLKIEADKYLLIKTPKDISEAKRLKKLGVCFVFQGTNPLAKSLGMIDIYYQLGVRSMMLCYNVRNAIGDGCIEPSDAGLSQFGIHAVARMNEVGMLIDCSHTGYRTSMDAMSRSTAPVIFSHSNVYALKQHPRNLKDDQIKACAATDGVIGINGVGILLGDENAKPTKYVEHIDYIAQLVGSQHVALGMDEIFFPEIMDYYMQENAVNYSKEYINAGINTAKNPKTKTQENAQPTQQWQCIRPHQIIDIAKLLAQRGYKNTDIQGILGNNYLRVIEKTWK